MVGCCEPPVGSSVTAAALISPPVGTVTPETDALPSAVTSNVTEGTGLPSRMNPVSYTHLTLPTIYSV